MNEFTTVYFAVISSLIAAIGYFLKSIVDDLKVNISETNMVKAKLDLVQQESFGKIDKLASITEIQISQLTSNIDKLTRIIDHMNNNMKHRDEILSNMFKDLNIHPRP